MLGGFRAAAAGRDGRRGSQRPLWLKATARAGHAPRPQAQAICDRIAANYVPWQEETFPGPARQRGRRPDREPLRPARHQLHHRRGLRQLARRASTRPSPSWRCGRSDLVDHRRCGHHERHPHVHVLHKTPALSPTGDCRPFSDAADGTMLGEGIADVRAQAAGRRRARRRPRLRRHPRRRRLLRRPGHGHLRAAAAGPGAGAAARVRVGRLRARTRSSWSRRTAPAPGPATPPSSPRCARSSASQPRRTGSGARSARSSRRSATPRPPRARPALIKAVLALHQQVLPPTIKVDQPNPGARTRRQPVLPEHRRRARGSRRRGPPAPRIGVQLRLRRHQLPRRARGVPPACRLPGHVRPGAVRRPDRAGPAERRHHGTNCSAGLRQLGPSRSLSDLSRPRPARTSGPTTTCGWPS